ncbi:acetyltransferase (GNAT) family protein [Kitasatospora sp. SolWspMP-SS2h]|uniref:GNAT family N-acetyltransferase n=1 Tax=Kitasatospora sp. SolWspMP-SS2h TaxID=1305729 RepID=UPI000DBF79A0|nr:acetyltransferase (GNAT) family protein [Kitasatospora sp. SolWspMP-SS2h]
MIDIRPTTEQDLDLFVETMHAAFGMFVGPPGADGGGVWWSAFEPERGLLAHDADGRPIGTAGAYTFELTLPGGRIVPVSGVTAVGALPSHRRRGVLTAMMRRQLAELRGRGEVLAVLLASESLIHRRFGYGPATSTQRYTVPRRRAALAPARAGSVEAGTVELLHRGRAVPLLEHRRHARPRRRRPVPRRAPAPPADRPRRRGHLRPHRPRTALPALVLRHPARHRRSRAAPGRVRSGQVTSLVMSTKRE